MASVAPLKAHTVRIQVYLPHWLAQAFFAYLREHGLTQAEAGRRAIRGLVKQDNPPRQEAIDRIEMRLAATLEREGGEFRDAITEIRQMLAEIRALLRQLAGQQ